MKMKKIVEVKKLIKPLILLTLLGTSSQAMAGSCIDARGNTTGNTTNTGREMDVYVNLKPSIGASENLVVDLSRSISCKNDDPANWDDFYGLVLGSTLSSVLSSYNGSLSYYNNRYSMPLKSNTVEHFFKNGNYLPLNLQLYISPLNSAGGYIVNAGDSIATLYFSIRGVNLSTGPGPVTIVKWNILANNSVIVPTGGCDVSARDVSIILPAYDATVNPVPVPLMVNCPSGNKNLSYFLSGTTADTAGKIFSNTSTASPASGIGIQMLDQNNNAITVNNAVPLGTVGNTPVNLNLKATYAQTGAQVTAGNVQSVIGVTFTYP